MEEVNRHAGDLTKVLRPWRYETLLRLQIECNEVIKSLNWEEMVTAVNWAGVSCYEAQLVIPQKESPFWRVIIMEAAPEAHVFISAVEEGLKERGWLDVEVTTEW